MENITNAKEPRETLAANVSFLLEVLRLSQADLAKSADVSQKTISNMVHNRHSVSVENVGRVAIAFSKELRKRGYKGKLTGWGLIGPGTPGDLLKDGSISDLIETYYRLDEDGQKYLLDTAKRENNRAKSA